MLVGLYQRWNDQSAPGYSEVANARCLEFVQHIADFAPKYAWSAWITGRELAQRLLVRIQKTGLHDIPFFTNDHWTKLSCITLISQKSSKNIYGHGSIPIHTIFRGMNIHKYQLFWCEQKGYQGFDPSPHLVMTSCGIAVYPLVNVYITMENHHFQWVDPLFLWSCSNQISHPLCGPSLSSRPARGWWSRWAALPFRSHGGARAPKSSKSS